MREERKEAKFSKSLFHNYTSFHSQKEIFLGIQLSYVVFSKWEFTPLIQKTLSILNEEIMPIYMYLPERIAQ